MAKRRNNEAEEAGVPTRQRETESVLHLQHSPDHVSWASIVVLGTIDGLRSGVV